MFRPNLKVVKQLIAEESAFREDKQGFYNAWKDRVVMMSAFPEDMWRSIVLTNCSGEKGKCLTLGEMVDMTEKPWRWIIRVCNDMKTCCEYSRHKEKFYRYAYNEDLPNMRKYHAKLQKHETDMIEDMSESPERYRVNIYKTESNEEEEAHYGQSTSEAGLLNIAEEYKRFYEVRKDFIGWGERGFPFTPR